MKPKLKKIADQVIVITGASSGIGLTTARMAARRGARLVLVSRNAQALQQLTDELQDAGGAAIYACADVGDERQVRNAAEVAIGRFGGFDTWINNAGVSIFGRNEEVALADQRRVFETNFWGVVHGSLAAVEHLKLRGGALINLGSEVSDLAIPLQGIYSASKHAVKGYTDSLRLELEEAGAPISVTLIKPAAIDTMFVPHAKNYLEVEPKLPSPIYAPEVVAEAILSAARYPQRDIYVGGAAKFNAAAAHYIPRIIDKYMERFLFKAQKSANPPRDRDDHALYAPGVPLMERQGHDGHVLESSLYTKAVTNPKMAGMIVAGALAAAAVVFQTQRRVGKRLWKG